jgi:hypothetical protein
MATFKCDRRLCGNADTQTIRIMDLVPGEATEPISCQLKYVCLNDNPKYEAISYCWGGQVPSLEIECNGGRMKITENLSEALRAFRKPNTIISVWADAICINQKDKDEKTSQVPLMQKIYGQASNVNIWLGEESQEQDCEMAFQFIRKLYNASLKFKGVERPKIDLEYGVPTLGLPGYFNSGWRNVYRLLKRPWFFRVWVIQEVAMAQEANVRYGNSSMPWREFSYGIDFAQRINLLKCLAIYDRKRITLREQVCLLHMISTTLEFQRYREAGLDLLTLLRFHSCAEASDPRDKVFALLGLSRKTVNQDAFLVPDYNLDTSVVFKNVTKYALEFTPTLDILSVPKLPECSLNKNLPS